MILADKIIRLRKKNGWSQEELAEKMNVSRQAVSKWEAAQTIPDLEKLMKLSSLFGVTIDYLVKDEIEDEEFTDSEESPIKRVSLADAHAYLASRAHAAKKIAFATMLCVLSPIPLIALTAFSEYKALMSEDTAVAIGVGVLLAVVTAAVAIFVNCGFINAPFEFLDEVYFETEYGVAGMVNEKKSAYRKKHSLLNTIGVCLCVASPIPLIVVALTLSEFYAVLMVCLLLAIVASAVFLFVLSGVKWASMQRLLRDPEYAPNCVCLDEKTAKNKKICDSVEGAVWACAAAVYFIWSFTTDAWHVTWVVWVIAAAIDGIIHAILGQKN